jgi:hypothetical protein
MKQSLKWLALVAFGVLSLGMLSWAAERVDAGIQSRLDECTCTYCRALLDYEDTQSRALALVLALAHPRTGSESPDQDGGEVGNEPEPSFACERQALDAEQHERHQALMGQLRSAVEEIRELPAGYEFALPAETSTILAAAEFISLERQCCPFLKFELDVSSDGPALLRLTGAKGVKEFLREVLSGSA